VRRAAAVVPALLVLWAGNARAQGVPPAGRVEVGGGIAWMGKSALGSADATQTTPSGGSSRLFSTSSELDAAAGWELHVGVRVTQKLELAAGASLTKPTISTMISNDVESSASVTATETIKQYGFSGGALWYLSLRRPKLFPFVVGSGGYLRQLHEADTLAVTGKIFTLGAGAKYFFAPDNPSWRKGLGLRGDAGVVIRTGGVAFGDQTLYSPLLRASIFARF
jgi:hypothetical protein